jgi:hypothetical protein
MSLSKSKVKAKKILIPLISKEETSNAFIEKAVKGAKEIILLLVIDTNAMHNSFGFAASEIRQGNMLIEDLKYLLKKKKKHVEEIIEWGNTATKIIQLTKLKEIQAIVLKKQENHFFNELVEKLRKELRVEIKII